MSHSDTYLASRGGLLHAARDHGRRVVHHRRLGMRRRRHHHGERAVAVHAIERVQVVQRHIAARHVAVLDDERDLDERRADARSRGDRRRKDRRRLQAGELPEHGLLKQSLYFVGQRRVDLVFRPAAIGAHRADGAQQGDPQNRQFRHGSSEREVSRDGCARTRTGDGAPGGARSVVRHSPSALTWNV